MTIQERGVKLASQAKVLALYYNVTSSRLQRDLMNFVELWNTPGHVEPELFAAILDMIEAEIEDLCLANKITEEELDELVKQQ